MSAEEVRAAYLEWVAEERGAAPPVVEAYGRDVTELLVFLMMSQGRMPTEKTLAELSGDDLRAFIESRAEAGVDEATRARQLHTLRGFRRFLRRRNGTPNPET